MTKSKEPKTIVIQDRSGLLCAYEGYESTTEAWAAHVTDEAGRLFIAVDAEDLKTQLRSRKVQEFTFVPVS